MRIQGPRFGDIPARQPQTHGPDGSRNVPVTDTHTSEIRTAGLSRLFETGGMPQSTSLIRSLETALHHAGIHPESLDRTAALRALLLHRYNLPLTEAAVTGKLEGLPSITETVATLVHDARTLMSSGKLSASDRQFVAALIGDIAALYDHPSSSPVVSGALTATVEKWAFDTESLLAAIISGDTDTQFMPPGMTLQSIDSMINFILSPQALDRYPAATRDAIEVFRDVLARFLETVSAVDMSRPETSAAVREAFVQFENNLPEILSMLIPSTSTGSSEQLSAALRDLFGRQFATLQAILETFIPNAPSGAASDLIGLMNRSGIMFEWHLLAWYRAGKDPARLRNLYRQDLKGILLTFTRDRRLAHKNGQGRSPLTRLGTRAAEVLERIETAQYSTLLDRNLSPRSVVMDVPLAGRPENGQAQVRITDESGEKPQISALREFTLSFAVDTMALGKVTAYLTVSGRALSVTVELEDEKWIELVDHMTTEVRDALNEHGFAVGQVSIIRAGTRQASHGSNMPGKDVIA